MSTQNLSWTRDHDLVVSQRALVTFLSALPGLVAVLDAERRMVWASPDLLRFLGLPVSTFALGRRPGEALGCVHAFESSRGCGGAPACYQCGAVRTILDSKRLDRKIVRLARIQVTQPRSPRYLNLEFTAAPWTLEDRQFTILTFQ
jgi:PAS domain-containing protein